MTKSKSASRCVLCHTRQILKFTYQGYAYHRCPHCGLMTTLPYPSPAAIVQHYRKRFVVGNYQILQHYADAYKIIYQEYAALLANRLARNHQTLAGAKVLDIGCFTGDFLEILHDQKAEVYGIELQAQAVKIANRKLPGRIFQPAAFDRIRPRPRFDAVTLLGVIEHVTDPQNLLARIRTLLKPGGTFILQTANTDSWLATLMGRLWPPYAPVEHIHLPSRKSMEAALRRNGFEDITFRPHWKKLPIEYVYQMLLYFGPEFHALAKPLVSRLPRWLVRLRLPFYIGEMIMTARKQPA